MIHKPSNIVVHPGIPEILTPRDNAEKSRGLIIIILETIPFLLFKDRK